MHRGYIKLWRKSKESKIISEGMGIWGFWCWLLINVNHKKGYFMGTKILPSQIATSYGSLSEKIGASIKVVRNWIDKLIDMKMITKENRANRFTLITICNWPTYNQVDASEGQTEGKPGANQGQQSKNDKNKSNTYTPDKSLPSKDPKTQPEWKKHCETFVQYQLWESKEYHKIINNLQWISERREFHTPRYNRQLNITETIRKAHVDYWSKPVGWKKIKSRRGQTIDWESTWNNALSMRCNEVWEDVTPENIQQPKIPAIHRTPEVEI